MRMNETLKSIARRWYVVLVGLMLTAAMGWVVNDRVPTSFEATGSLLLMPPAVTVGTDGNPYLYLGGMSQALDVLVRRASAPEVQQGVIDKYPSSTYTVQADRTTTSPIILVTADAPTGTAALDTMNAALASVESTLNVMQNESDVKKGMRVVGQNLVLDTKATAKTKTRMQLLIAVVGVGGVGTLLLAGVIDGWVLQRRERRASAPAKQKKSTDPALHSPPGRVSGNRAATAGPPQVEAAEEPSKAPLSVP